MSFARCSATKITVWRLQYHKVVQRRNLLLHGVMEETGPENLNVRRKQVFVFNPRLYILVTYNVSWET
jgi:hypothetical protein